MSGAAHGATASVLRGVLSAAEPFYSCGMTLRNRLYDTGIRHAHALGRPTISVGNITAGGTGKTPVVRFLAERLIADGHRPAILLRGYKSTHEGESDEQQLLERHLNEEGLRRAVVRANPDRVATARAVLAEDPQVSVFILDDAFQHRRAARELDIVLINAASPFGYGHVHPRGLLRESLSGLSRAHAIILTHADEVPESRIDEIESEIRRYHPLAPILRSAHVQSGLRTAARSAALTPDVPLDELRQRKFFAVSGIGRPQSLQRQLGRFNGTFVGHQWFGDHHRYTDQDMTNVRCAAEAVGAELIVVTEKDWVKIERLHHANADHRLPILRLDVEIRFENGGDQRLMEQVRAAVRAPSAVSTAQATAAS